MGYRKCAVFSKMNAFGPGAGSCDERGSTASNAASSEARCANSCGYAIACGTPVADDCSMYCMSCVVSCCASMSCGDVAVDNAGTVCWVLSGKIINHREVDNDIACDIRMNRDGLVQTRRTFILVEGANEWANISRANNLASSCSWVYKFPCLEKQQLRRTCQHHRTNHIYLPQQS